jgi:hypothetical protein
VLLFAWSHPPDPRSSRCSDGSSLGCHLLGSSRETVTRKTPDTARQPFLALSNGGDAEKRHPGTLTPSLLKSAVSGKFPSQSATDRASYSKIPFQLSRARGGRYAYRQSAIFLCLEPSLLEHNGAIVTCCFSQRCRSRAVVERSNKQSTIEFP